MNNEQSSNERTNQGYNLNTQDVVVKHHVVALTMTPLSNVVMVNCATEAGISKLSVVSTILQTLAKNPTLLADVLNSSEFYQRKLQEKQYG